MDLVVTTIVRLGVGLFLAVMLGLLGLVLATLVIPPIYSGDPGYLFLRVSLIGAGSGLAGVAAWATWRETKRETFVLGMLALVGGVGSAVVSYTWVDFEFDGTGSIEKALRTGSLTVTSAVLGANLPPALYSLIEIYNSLRKWRD